MKGAADESRSEELGVSDPLYSVLLRRLQDSLLGYQEQLG